MRLARAVGSSHTWRAVPCGLGGVTSHHAVVADRIMRTVGHIASRWSTVRGHRAHAGRLPGWVRGMATDGQCSACGQGRACGSYLALHAEGVSLESARLPVAAMCVCVHRRSAAGLRCLLPPWIFARLASCSSAPTLQLLWPILVPPITWLEEGYRERVRSSCVLLPESSCCCMGVLQPPWRQPLLLVLA